MYAILDEEHQQLRDTVRGFLTQHSNEQAVRECMLTDTGYDAAIWRRLGQQLGVHGLAVPERFGGSGLGWLELGIVAEEMGRALVCAPFLSTVALAATTLVELGDEGACQDYLPGIVSGDKIATLTLTDPDRATTDAATVTGQPSTTGWRVNGTAQFVLDGALADVIFVTAHTPSGIGVFAVDGGASGLERRLMPTLDLTRKMATLAFHDTPARQLEPSIDASDALTTVLQLASVALAAEQLGGGERVLEMSVDYAKTRHQFGRPIGSFQAIKHKCADIMIEVESARSAVRYALWAADHARAELPIAASIAKAYCSEAFVHAASENIQVHGGIGFTWEHSAHLYFKRAKTSEVLFGHATRQRELLLQHLGI